MAFGGKPLHEIIFILKLYNDRIVVGANETAKNADLELLSVKLADATGTCGVGRLGIIISFH